MAPLAVTAFFSAGDYREDLFNAIWRVRQPRRGISSFLLYWAILSLGPLLLGAGFAVTTYITSLSLLSGPGCADRREDPAGPCAAAVQHGGVHPDLPGGAHAQCRCVMR